MDYPQEWDQLTRNERRKKLKKLRQKHNKKSIFLKKIRNGAVILVVLLSLIAVYKTVTKKSPEEIKFEEKVEAVSLDGRVEEFDIEGREHVSIGTDVSYQTNPPTSGDHFSEAKTWGVYKEEIEDLAAVHGLEHGGIWISYKDISEEEIETLKDIGKANSQSVIVSPRSANEDKIVVTSWGRMMRLEILDKALIQKYIDTYKNQSPEKLAI